MAHYGTLRDFRFENDVRDVRGATLYGQNDEKLGTIDDVIFDHATGGIRYAVVDTGGWMKNKFLVPAGRIQPYHRNEDDFYADLDKERIQMFPPFEEKHLKSEKDWNAYEEKYGAVWTESPVLHEEGSTHTITPPADQMPSSGAGQAAATGTGADREITAEDLFPERMGVEQRLILNPSTNWSTKPATLEPDRVREIEEASHMSGRLTPRLGEFEHHVQRNRERIVSACDVCGKKAA